MPKGAAIDEILPGTEALHPCTRIWFAEALESPTRIQREAWPVLASGKSALLLAPTGSGKTLAAFLAAIDRLMFAPETAPQSREGEAPAEPLAAPTRLSRSFALPNKNGNARLKPGVRVLYIS